MAAELPVTCWGPWTLDRDGLVLVAELDGRCEVDLQRCPVAGSVFDWIGDVGSKPWATADVLGELLRALCDLLDPEAWTCRPTLAGERQSATALRERIVAAEVQTRAHRLVELREPWRTPVAAELRHPPAPAVYSPAEYERWHAEAVREVRVELGLDVAEGAR